MHARMPAPRLYNDIWTSAAYVYAYVALRCTRSGAGASTLVDWSSSPAQPNSTVLVSGTGLQLAPLTLTVDGQPGWPLAGGTSESDANSLRFVLPPSASGRRQAFDVVSAGNRTVLRGNAPDPWWWQGDRGSASTAGSGWLRVLGRALDGGATTKLRLANESGTVATLVAHSASVYDAQFVLPPRLAAGDYTAAISNGLRNESSPAAWSPLVMFLDASSWVRDVKTLHWHVKCVGSFSIDRVFSRDQNIM